jgi:hypothetical protein
MILVDQSALELQVSTSVSALAVAPVAHPEGTSLLSSDATMQAKANLGSTELEKNSSVNCLHIVFSAFADDRQAQQPVLGMFTNAQNTVIAGGTFSVSLSRRSCK